MGLRVIGGELRGRRLRSVKGYQTRPTADRIREALFNILSKRVAGAVVLDLFAGTGALGIEAMSRGAESAVFIDIDTRATRIIEQNIAACFLEKRTRCIRWDIVKNLNCLRPYPHMFDLVLMDPPYDRNMILPSVANLHRSGCLKAKACIVVEHGSLDAVLEESVPFSLFDQRRYGKTLVSFLTNMILEEPLRGGC
jgi:16S rRNA (guanine966-N2)-methyltransferase